VQMTAVVDATDFYSSKMNIHTVLPLQLILHVQPSN
jgi:hypothetical protein